jgi:2-oxoisovalerate dehydrogenase E1 component
MPSSTGKGRGRGLARKGPILRFQGWLEENGIIHSDDVDEIEADIDNEIAEAVAFAEAGTWEPLENLTRYVMAPEAAGGAGSA